MTTQNPTSEKAVEETHGSRGSDQTADNDILKKDSQGSGEETAIAHKDLERDGPPDTSGSEDYEPEPKMTFRRMMAFVGMAMMWTSSQIPVYLFGGIPPLIYGDIGGVEIWIWFVTGYLLGLAGICPWVGALSDLLGRRWVAIVGMVVLIAGQVIASLAGNMNVFIAGMTVSGVGAGINELTCIAGTAELVPTRKRGVAIAILILTIAPWVPSVMWGQLIAAHATWRYVGVLTCVWTALGLIIVLAFYFPPPRPNAEGLTARQILARVDYIGGSLSIVSTVLFCLGILWGGYNYPWADAHVIAPLVLGGLCFVAFILWEAYGASYPMVPRRMVQSSPRNFLLLLLITFISGANFFAVLLLWPTQAYNVYGHDPVAVGLRGLPFGLSVMIGCIVTCLLLTRLRGGNKWLLLGASALMTAGCGAMSAARRDNEAMVYGVLVVAGLGVGGIIIPASLIITIICPADLIATVTALTLAVRVVGGAVGYAVYYNVLVEKLTPLIKDILVPACLENGVATEQGITGVVDLTIASLTNEILLVVGGNQTAFDNIVLAGQLAYAGAYPWVYYCSIAFGGLAVVAALFLEDIGQFMDDKVAVILQ